jgi:hypothetical protein
LGGLPARATTVQTWVVHSHASRSFRFRAPHSAFQVTVHVAPTFSPAKFGLPDSRQLGVQASFVLVPARRGR